MTQEFADSKIAVHAITAEPGDIRGRLTNHGLPELEFPVHSDPSWNLMSFMPKEEIYVVGGGPDPNKSGPPAAVKSGYCDPYKMVQPALVIADKQGNVRTWWSWNKLQSGKLFPAEDNFNGGVPNQRTAENPTGNTHDVRWRPVPADILANLKKGVPDAVPKVENIGFPNKKDHDNPLGLNPTASKL